MMKINYQIFGEMCVNIASEMSLEYEMFTDLALGCVKKHCK